MVNASDLLTESFILLMKTVQPNKRGTEDQTTAPGSDEVRCENK